MDRRLRIDVADRHAKIIFVLEIAWYFPIGDLLEKRFFGIHGFARLAIGCECLPNLWNG